MIYTKYTKVHFLVDKQYDIQCYLLNFLSFAVPPTSQIMEQASGDMTYTAYILAFVTDMMLWQVH